MSDAPDLMAEARANPAAVLIDDLNISVRTCQALKRAGVVTIGDLFKTPQAEWLQAFRIGRKSLGEIREVLEALDATESGTEAQQLSAEEPATPAREPLFRRDVVYTGSAKRESATTLTCVYFIRCGEFVKIGVAANARSRCVNLQAGNPHPIELLHVSPCEGNNAAIIGVEYGLHKRFERLHHRGEWFRYEGELRDYVEGLRAGRTE